MAGKKVKIPREVIEQTRKGFDQVRRGEGISVRELDAFFIFVRILYGQYHACTKKDAESMESAKAHIQECLICREQLRWLRNKITDLVRPRPTKELR